MIVSEIPIKQYLSNATAAGSESAYAALIVVVARAADRSGLVAQTLRDWTSLHSVTSDIFAFVCPCPSASARVPLPHAPGYGTNTTGLRAGGAHGQSQDWWSRSGGPPSELLHRTGEPADGSPYAAAAGEHAFTMAVNETMQFLGLRETPQPCIAVLSLWENEVLLLPVADEFDLYPFLCDLSASFEGVADRMASARDATYAARRLLPSAQRRRRRRERASANVWARWQRRVERTLDDLDESGGPEVKATLPELRSRLTQVRTDPEAALATVARVTGLAPWSARLVWIGRRIAQGMVEEREAEERLREADHACTSLELTVATEEARYARLKREARLSAHVLAAVPKRGLRRLTVLPQARGPWPVRVLQRENAAVVRLTLESGLS
ncbi:hypothetical protein AB0G32_35265 [Streptomyces sp. NPDC023723]|uniref:hypothetical protein n=1 Tax=Streptomyces sp. NPDC023723 TaxID=3154323 RepID=UPI003407D425